MGHCVKSPSLYLKLLSNINTIWRWLHIADCKTVMYYKRCVSTRLWKVYVRCSYWPWCFHLMTSSCRIEIQLHVYVTIPVEYSSIWIWRLTIYVLKYRIKSWSVTVHRCDKLHPRNYIYFCALFRFVVVECRSVISMFFKSLIPSDAFLRR